MRHVAPIVPHRALAVATDGRRALKPPVNLTRAGSVQSAASSAQGRAGEGTEAPTALSWTTLRGRLPPRPLGPIASANYSFRFRAVIDAVGRFRQKESAARKGNIIGLSEIGTGAALRCETRHEAPGPAHAYISRGQMQRRIGSHPFCDGRASPDLVDQIPARPSHATRGRLVFFSLSAAWREAGRRGASQAYSDSH